MPQKPAPDVHECPACWTPVKKGRITAHRAVCIRWWHLQNVLKLGIRKQP